MREGDRIRHAPLSPRHQLAFAAGGFFGFACLLVVVFAYLMQSSRVDELSVALAESQASNQFLLNSMNTREGDIGSRAQDLENDIAAVTKLAKQTRAFQDCAMPTPRTAPSWPSCRPRQAVRFRSWTRHCAQCRGAARA